MQAVETPNYQTWDIYQDASRGAQEAIDAVFAAVAKQTSIHKGLDADAVTGNLGISFTWHDGAQYRVQMTGAGTLDRLFRLQFTGRLVDDGDGGQVEDVVWRTVREFSRDRAGKMLARLAGLPQSHAWDMAASK